jgi:hypothetical protein
VLTSNRSSRTVARAPTLARVSAASSDAGSSAVTLSSRCTSGTVAIPVPAPISTTAAPGSRPARSTKRSKSCSG